MVVKSTPTIIEIDIIYESILIIKLNFEMRITEMLPQTLGSNSSRQNIWKSENLKLFLEPLQFFKCGCFFSKIEDTDFEFGTTDINM